MTDVDAVSPAMAAFERAALGRVAATLCLTLGQETGLLPALATGPISASALAERCSTDQRMTLEWCRCMVVAGLATYADGQFAPADGYAEIVADDGAGSLAEIFAASVRRDATLLDRQAEAVRTGRGIPHAAYEPVLSRAQDRYSSRVLRRHLVPTLLGAVPEVVERLAAGCDLVELGCGGGTALRLLAEAFPRSRYWGIELDPVAVRLARDRVAGHDHVEIVERDAAELPPDAYDVVLALDVVHDLGDPAGVLGVVRAALRAGGMFVMCETDATGDFAEDAASVDPFAYFSSLAMCIPTSQAAGGPGLGSAWGRSGALPMLADAGFADVTVTSVETGHAVYACRR
ncbi:MAG TPA: class I SAM-dependent methyltransferase [Lapillicoccus sp.]|nr:class I SAM-dependent methyltransferase [Lapillicoccus sp.]